MILVFQSGVCILLSLRDREIVTVRRPCGGAKGCHGVILSVTHHVKEAVELEAQFTAALLTDSIPEGNLRGSRCRSQSCAVPDLVKHGSGTGSSAFVHCFGLDQKDLGIADAVLWNGALTLGHALNLIFVIFFDQIARDIAP